MIADRIRAVIVAQLGVPIEKLTDDARLDALGIDSLEMLDLVFEIEKQMGVQLREEDFPLLQTLGDVIDLVGRASPRREHALHGNIA